MKIKKIDDRAKPQPIDDVADRAADDEADRDRQKARVHSTQPEDQDEDDQQGGERKDQRTGPAPVEEAKADPGIAGQDEVEKRADRNAMESAAGFVEEPQHQRLGYLIEHRRRRR